MDLIPVGVYRFVAPPMGQWYLERIMNRFEFPFKVYNAGEDIIQRVSKRWDSVTGNLGVMMNGLRGAGKTMTAQILANSLMDKLDIPVLVVREPIPLQSVFSAVQQNMVVIFDEFEKTHNENIAPGCQQELLSTIDGMSRSHHKRLVIFTTNSPSMDGNFLDRPSRIHYKFEFARVADEIIEGLIEDSLPQRLMHFKPDIMDFLHSRDICTIDIVKAVISEVNIFEESPTEFEDKLNVAKGTPPAFKVFILDEHGNEKEVISRFFRPHMDHHTGLLTGSKSRIQEFKDKMETVEIDDDSVWSEQTTVRLLEKCEEDACWLAEIKLPKYKTFYNRYGFLGNECLWLDNPPDGWKLPSAAEALDDKKVRKQVLSLWEQSTCEETLHGTGKRAVYKVKILPVPKEIYYSPRFSVTGTSAYIGD